MLAIIALLTILTLLGGLIYRKFIRKWIIVRDIPGASALPIIGHAHLFFGKKPEEYIEIVKDMMDKYGDTIKVWLGPELNILTSDTKYIETIFTNNKFIEKAGMYDLLQPWLNDGLLLSKGKKWFKRRKIITPAFHFEILEQFVDIFDDQSNVLIKNLKQFRPVDEVELYTFITLYALDVICESAMGIKVDAQINTDSKYVQAVKSITHILHKRIIDVAYRPDFLFNLTKLATEQKNALKVLHDFSRKVIESRRDELLQSETNGMKVNPNVIDNEIGAKSKSTFLDILLKSEIDGQSLSNSDIQEEVDTFMFEGHDTTASAIHFCFYNLARYPDAQQKCVDEIIQVIGKDQNIPITYSAINGLHYLELCIKETLRLYPSVPVIARKVSEESIINGLRIPAGTNIAISPFHLGRMEKLFPNANEFIPERFDVVTSSEKMNPYAYIPFSAGPRNCIGQKFAMLEIKSVVSKVLRNFKIELAQNDQLPVVIGEIILKTKNSLNFRLKPRVY